MTDGVEQLMTILENDMRLPFPKFPSVTLPLLRDQSVQASVRRRLERGGQLLHVPPPRYSFTTGLLSTCFVFSPPPGPIGHTDAVLVLSDGSCKVVGLIDPFDRERPNAMVPPLPADSDQPFALARPTLSRESQQVASSELYPLEVRSREFFAELELTTPRMAPGPGQTKCSWETSGGTECLIRTDVGDDITWRPLRCDEWISRVTTDEILDDSGPNV